MQRVYAFNEGNATMKDLLGGKGSNLAEMTQLKLPVPLGFTITTEACLEYLNNSNGLSDELKKEIIAAVKTLEKTVNKQFNSDTNLLLVSVRSGAKFSMPGMMDTILNLGLNDENVIKLANLTQNEAFAYDCYRRLLQMYGNVVYELDGRLFENILAHHKEKNNYTSDNQLSVDDLKQIVIDFNQIFVKELGHPFPQNVNDQIFAAV